MKQKNATPDKGQAEAICRAGLRPEEWVVVKDYPYSMILRRRGSQEFRMIRK